MKNRIRKILVRFLILPVIFLIVLVITAAVVLYYQQQRLVSLAVTELNKQLPGELEVGGSTISILQNFPYVSIAVKDVHFYSNKQKTGRSLFDAEKIFVGFSLSDILNQNYRVKVIFMKNGSLDLVQDADGKLDIVEAARISSDTSGAAKNSPAELNLDLKKIVLKNMKISYLDKQRQQQVVVQIDKIQSSFHSDSLQVYADLQGAMVGDYSWPGDPNIFRHKHLETKIRLSYVKANQILNIEECRLKLEDALFNISGTADLLHNNLVDLKFSGDKTDFRQLFAFAPDELAKELKHFTYDGRLDFKGTVKGKLQDGKMPRIDLSFSCKNGWLHNTVSKRKLDSLAFTGYYTNGAKQSLQSSELRLLNVGARPDKGVFRGNFILRDFTNPKISMKVNADLELEFIGDFLGIKDLQRITGHINLKMDF